jgi:signal peptidase II
MKTKWRYWFFAIFAVLSLALDQLSKIWARRTLRPIYPQVKTVISGYWEFRYSENRGAAFGMLREIPGAHLAFALAAVAVAVGAAIYLGRARLRHPLRVAVELGFVVGGALGNAVDRVLFGRVTDFVVWRIGTHEWNTFNVADAALVVGILGLLIDSGRPRASGDKSANAASAA